MAKKQKKSSFEVSKKDLVGFSLDEMLTKAYGSKGTAERKKAEAKIAILARTLHKRNRSQ